LLSLCRFIGKVKDHKALCENRIHRDCVLPSLRLRTPHRYRTFSGTDLCGLLRHM